MTAERWRRIEDLFEAYIGVAPEDREAFLAEQTGADQELAMEVRSLGAAHFTRHRLDAPLAGLTAGTRIGPYSVERLLGSGGMGNVYLARRADEQFDKDVAIKLLARGLVSESLLRRFRLERQILARLDHPNIARLLDGGITEIGQPYIVMEYIDGRPVDSYCAEERLDQERALELWLKIATAVSYAHRHLVIHRDLKPGNILVSKDGEPKLLDFGVAKLLGEERPAAQETLGPYFTPLYASPEQIRGGAVTTSSDVFALGELMCLMATGKHPFGSEAQGIAEVVQRIQERDPELPRALPSDLAAIVAMALRKDPARRYGSVEQFADDVRRYRGGMPVSARPDTLRYRTARFVSRHRGGVAVTGLLVVGLIGTTATALYQARAAVEQRRNAEAISSFFIRLFGAELDQYTPDSSANLRISDLIDRGVASVDQLRGQPETEADLRQAIGRVYAGLGLLDRAEPQLQRGLELHRRLFTGKNEKIFADLYSVGSVLLARGRFAEAEAQFRSAAAAWPRSSPPGVTAVGQNLGHALLRQGKLAEAEQVLLAHLASAGRIWGPNHPNLGMSYSNLGAVYLERGDLERARQQFEHAAEALRSAATPPPAQIWTPLVNLANIYRFQGDYSKTKQYAEESYRALAARVGDSYSMIHGLSLMSYAKVNLGEADAEEPVRRGIAIQKRQLQAGHFELAVGQTFLGYVLMKEGKAAEAEKELREALELRRKTFPPPNWRVAETAGYLGEALARAGRGSEARALLEESYSTMERLYGANHPRTREAAARRAEWTR